MRETHVSLPSLINSDSRVIPSNDLEIFRDTGLKFISKACLYQRFTLYSSTLLMYLEDGIPAYSDMSQLNEDNIFFPFSPSYIKNNKIIVYITLEIYNL